MLDYVGKSGRSHNISIEDARLARLVRRCQELPGQILFQYVGDDGTRHPVTSADVNTYLRDCSGDFTAKHFRTWTASVLAFDYLATAGSRPSLKAMLEQVANKLGNTTAIARKSYVHPALIDAVREGSAISVRQVRGTFRQPRALTFAHPDKVLSSCGNHHHGPGWVSVSTLGGLALNQRQLSGFAPLKWLQATLLQKQKQREWSVKRSAQPSKCRPRS